MQHGREFDADYNAHLGDDAIPALLDSLEFLSADQKQTVAFELADRYCRIAEESDWRSLNISRRNASNAMRNNRETIEALALCDSERICCGSKKFGLD